MISFWSLLSLVHLVGLSLGLGAASVKTMLLLKCYSERSFLTIYVGVTKPITRFIVLGIVLMTASGIGWMFLGYSFSTLLVVKHVLVAILWVLGLAIDNVVEPKFVKLSSMSGEPPTPEFQRIQKQHLLLEIMATMVFYVITVIGVYL